MTPTNQKGEVSPLFTSSMLRPLCSCQPDDRIQSEQDPTLIVLDMAACAGCGWQQLCAAHRAPFPPR